MNTVLFEAIAYLLGTITGTFLLIPPAVVFREYKKFLVSILSAVLISLLFYIRMGGGLGSLTDMANATSVSMVICAFAYVVIMAVKFRSEILRPINELHLLALSVTMLCILYFRDAHILTFFIFSLPLSIVIVFAFTPVIISKRWRATLYCLYLALLAILMLYSVDLSELLSFIDAEKLTLKILIQSFLTGTIFCYVLTHITYIFKFIPVKSKNESRWFYENRRAEYFSEIVEKFSTKQYGILSNLGITVVTILIFIGCQYLVSFKASVIITFLATGTTLGGRILTGFINKKSAPMMPSTQSHISANLVVIPVVAAYIAIVICLWMFYPISI